jgi:cell division protein FtsL
MAKKTSIRKKVYRWRVWVVYLFMIAITLQIGSAILLRSYQSSLSVQIQQTEQKIAAMSSENESLNVDIQRLGNYNRIVAIASEEGYSSVNQNVITVFNKTE